MFDFIDDLDIEWDKAGIALLLWAGCLLLIWKFFDQNLMKFYIKIIMTVLMLPLSYVLTVFISNR